MEMYTTDTIPSNGAKPVEQAWFVMAQDSPKPSTPESVLALLKEQAAEGGADAVIGVRLVRSDWLGGGTLVAYGTAVKLKRTGAPFAERR